MGSKNIMQLVESQREQIASALPAGVSPGRVVRLVRTVVSSSDIMQRCTPRSVLGAAIECAQLGLEPGITAHLVPYWSSKNKTYSATLIVDYRGLMQLARRSGQIGAIYADVVREGDTFDYQRGDSPSLTHKPRLGNEGAVIAAYAVARYTGGDSQFEVISKRELDQTKEQSLSKVRNERSRAHSPWVEHEEAMQKKTALRRLCKFLPTAIEDAELQRAVVLDEAGDRGEQNLGTTIDADFEELGTQPEQAAVLDEEAQQQLREDIETVRRG